MGRVDAPVPCGTLLMNNGDSLAALRTHAPETQESHVFGPRHRFPDEAAFLWCLLRVPALGPGRIGFATLCRSWRYPFRPFGVCQPQRSWSALGVDRPPVHSRESTLTVLWLADTPAEGGRAGSSVCKDHKCQDWSRVLPVIRSPSRGPPAVEQNGSGMANAP